MIPLKQSPVQAHGMKAYLSQNSIEIYCVRLMSINFNNAIIILQTSNKPLVYYHTWYSLMMLNQSQVEDDTFNRTLQVKRSVPTRIWIPDLSVRALSVFARSFANFLKPKASWQEAPLHEGVHDWNATHPVRGSQILRSCRHKISILSVPANRTEP